MQGFFWHLRIFLGRAKSPLVDPLRGSPPALGREGEKSRVDESFCFFFQKEALAFLVGWDQVRLTPQKMGRGPLGMSAMLARWAVG